MKKRMLAVVVLLGCASPALAQRGPMGRTDISISGGAAVPLGTFGDAAKTGFQVGADIAYYTSPRGAIGVEFSYNRYDESDLQNAFWVWLMGDPDGETYWSTIQFTGYSKLLLSPRPSAPYLKAGAGLYVLRLTGTAYNITASTSESNFGLNGGMGYQFRGRGSTGGFVEGAFHVMLTEGSSTSFIGFRGGLTFSTGG